MKKILLLSLGAFLLGCSHPEEKPVAPVVKVKVARAELGDVQLWVRAPGTIFPREQANIAARIVAPIREMRVRKGDSVKAGQVLVQLEDRDLMAQRQEAAAAVTDALANLQKVAAGTLPADVERARGQVATTEAALNQAQKIYDRRRQLFEQGAIPGRDLLASETELAQSKANYEVAKKSLELLLQQSRDKDIRMAESRLEQAKARLAYIEAQLQFSVLRSPFAATVTEQFMYPGDMAKPDAPIVTLMDLSVAVARVQVPEGEAGALRTGQKCTFSGVDAPQASFNGRVSVVNRAVDAARRTVEVWCEIANPAGQLRGGVFGTGAILRGTAGKSVLVPEPAVQFMEGTDKGTVMVVDEKKIAHKRDVETGEKVEGKVQIKQGLKEGEQVVVEGGYGLPDGAQVEWEAKL